MCEQVWEIEYENFIQHAKNQVNYTPEMGFNLWKALCENMGCHHSVQIIRKDMNLEQGKLVRIQASRRPVPSVRQCVCCTWLQTERERVREREKRERE